MIPEITHLQFLVLLIIGGVQRSGRDIRERLQEEGDRRSLPAFYQLMSRLEKAGLVEGSDHRIDVEGQPVVERRYKVTGAGHKAAQQARDFYASSDLARGSRAGVRHA